MFNIVITIYCVVSTIAICYLGIRIYLQEKKIKN